MQARDKRFLLDGGEDRLSPKSIKLDETIPLDSVQHLLVKQPRPRRPSSVIPQVLKAKSRQLKKLRAQTVWVTGTRDDQVEAMGHWFPDVSDSSGHATKGGYRLYAQDPGNSTPLPSDSSNASGCPHSDIGSLAKLPGELRNRIYRLAFLQRDPIENTLEFDTCATGACLHSKVQYNTPGIANTCRQLRWEAMPIFCVENKAFQFDDGMVQQCCVGNFLRSVGDYASLITEFRLELKRPIWDNDKFIHWQPYIFTLTVPSKSASGKYELEQYEERNRLVCQCTLNGYLEALDSRMVGKPVTDVVQKFVDSDDFRDFVWRMRKSKQWIQHLKICKQCDQVLFNN